MSETIAYRIGVVVESEERYEHLMREHNSDGYFEIKFVKGISLRYLEKEEYPMIVSGTSEEDPFGVWCSGQLQDIIDDGYTVVIKKDQG